MFNFHNRHFIFRHADGLVRDFYCDHRQSICCSILGRNGIWSDVSIIARDAHQYFYAELGRDNFYHILYQDNSGNINYSKTDGQYSKTFPVLASKTPAVYNKHLYIAPLDDEIYLFYVLQHENSFLLAYQTVKNNRPGTPKIVDYVSGNSIPCAVLYDSDQNIYAFYQSYDGKYLQLGYKKFSTVRKHWSDFTAVTRYQGNCEYPHATMDPSGTIHLCYQRRAPKLFELVYQQKAPDKNLWSAETVLHSSVHPFENASILHVNGRIIVYWVRNDVIYWCAGSPAGDSWTRPARYGYQPGYRLQCVCFKDLLAGDSPGQGDGSSLSLSPGIFPGVVSDGFNLAFMDTGDITGGQPFQQIPPPSAAATGDTSGSGLKSLVLSIFKEMQDRISEMKTEWEEIKKEMPGLTSAYMELAKETEKLSIRLNMLENRLAQINSQYRRTEPSPGTVKGSVQPAADRFEPTSAQGAPTAESKHPASVSEQAPVSVHGSAQAVQGGPVTTSFKDVTHNGMKPSSTAKDHPAADDTAGTVPSETASHEAPAGRPKISPEPEWLKIWEEWKEPKEWSEGG